MFMILILIFRATGSQEQADPNIHREKEIKVLVIVDLVDENLRYVC